MPPDSDPIARNINKEDFEKTCRSCLCENDLTDIFELVFKGTLFSDIVDQLFVIEITPDDDLPKNICANCVNKVVQFYTFKKRFNDSQVILETILNPKSKSPEVEGVGTVTLRDESSTPETASSEDEAEENASNNISQEQELQTVSDTNIEKEAEESAGQDSEYIDHRKEINEEQRNQLNCNLCLMRFSTKSSLRMHFFKHHGKETPLVCTICKKAFRDNRSLNKHMVYHNEKKILCVECGKKFYTKSDLKVHSKVHSREKPYSCVLCSTSFLHQSSLKTHILSHTGERQQQHTCDICSKSFKTPYQLTNHLRTHVPKERFRRLRCEYCGRRYSRQENLDVHTRIHTLEKPYECDVCSERFSDFRVLKKHKKTVHLCKL